MGKHKKNVKIRQQLVDAYEQREDIFRANIPTKVYACYGNCGARNCDTCCEARKPTRKEIEQARAGHVICAPKPKKFPFYSSYDPLNPGYPQVSSALPILCPPFRQAFVEGQPNTCDRFYTCNPIRLVQGQHCAAPAIINYNCPGGCATGYANRFG